MSYETQRAWADRFNNLIQQTLAGVFAKELFKVAPDYEDKNQATDFVIVRSELRSVAARVRSPGYQQRFPHDFTIRYLTKCGDPDQGELAKIQRGFADCMFYAHAASDDPGDGFVSWMVIDLNEFRRESDRPHNHSFGDKCGICKYQERQVPGGNVLRAYNIYNFSDPERLVIDRGTPGGTREEWVRQYDLATW